MPHTPNWRPEGWKNPYYIENWLGRETYNKYPEFTLYEEGADALLKALKLKLDAYDGLLEALEKIAEGKGRFSMDRLTHAENTIEDMKELAKSASAKAQEKRE